MTLLKFSSLFKNVEAKWLASQESKLKAEFAPQLQALRETQRRQLEDLTRQSTTLQEKYRELERMQAQMLDQEAILADRKVRVEQANEECRTQLRLLEAKASPDSVWVEAFARGYEKAWETVWPIMASGVQNTKALIEQKAIEETLARLDTLITQRAVALGNVRAMDVQALEQKRREFHQKAEASTSSSDREKYANYQTALDWMLNANGVHQDQPAA